MVRGMLEQGPEPGAPTDIMSGFSLVIFVHGAARRFVATSVFLATRVLVILVIIFTQGRADVKGYFTLVFC
jgi:hypothetical protein